MEQAPSTTSISNGFAYRLHRTAAGILGFFILAHLFNHMMVLAGPTAHLEWMDWLRTFYRWTPLEVGLLIAVALQVVTGPILWRKNWKVASNPARKWQLLSGAYLQFFLLLHISAVISGRLVQGLDTNLYFGAAGLNAFPAVLFFVPYYSLGILAFFGHLATIHAQKMKSNLLGVRPVQQAWIMMGFALVLTMLILWGMTNGFQGLSIPQPYQF